MAHVFISYSSKDSDFGELCQLKLKDHGIEVWIDQGRLQAGDDWRLSIDEGIQSSDSLIVVISPNSAESSYVTYEWALALGLGVKIIPLLISPTTMHPRLEAFHYIDFTNARSRPWDTLIEKINKSAIPQHTIPGLDNSQDDGGQNDYTTPNTDRVLQDIHIAKNLILEYLDDNGFRMVSFERIRENIDHRYDNDFLMEVITNNIEVFKRAKLRGGKSGLKIR